MKSEMAGKTRHVGKNFFCRCGRSQQSVQAVMHAVCTFWTGNRPSQLEKGTCPTFGKSDDENPDINRQIPRASGFRDKGKVNTEGAGYGSLSGITVAVDRALDRSFMSPPGFNPTSTSAK
jgi:hypothetical protein